MGPRLQETRIRVGGDVVPGTIVRREGAVEFQISQEDQVLDIRYVGRAPLPGRLVDDSPFNFNLLAPGGRACTNWATSR